MLDMPGDFFIVGLKLLLPDNILFSYSHGKTYPRKRHHMHFFCRKYSLPDLFTYLRCLFLFWSLDGYVTRILFYQVDALTTKRGKEGGWVVERLLNQVSK